MLSKKMEGTHAIPKSSSKTCFFCDNIGGKLVLPILALTILCLCVGPTISKEVEIQHTKPTKAEEDACSRTPHLEECLSSIIAYRTHTDNRKEGSFLIALLKSWIVAVQDFKSFCNYSMLELSNPEHACIHNALSTCHHLLRNAEDRLDSSLSHLELLMKEPNSPLGLEDNPEDDILTWLSASLTYLSTCIEPNTYCKFSPIMENLIIDHGNISMVRAMNSISLASTMVPMMTSIGIPNHRGLHLSAHDKWMQGGRRHLLQESETPTACDVIVAQDGSGNYSTIQAAVDQVPSENNVSYTIIIKQGVYDEVVHVPSHALNVFFLGEGINKTIVTGKQCVRHNKITTFKTCTVCIDGDGFIAKDMTFQNTAGPEGRQAVAARVDSDKSAFYRCSFEGYQDTLYLHSHRQFYRNCTIHGTVDFIFGNAAAVFQNCNLILRRPLIVQQNAVTAHARSSPSQTTGFSFQNCRVLAAPELREIIFGPYNESISSFLGRPWGQYSRVVFMTTFIGEAIDAAGWVAWNASDYALGTLYYGEYRNFGPGGNFAYRVQWDFEITDPHIAAQFSIHLISGETWLPKTSIPYDYIV